MDTIHFTGLNQVAYGESGEDTFVIDFGASGATIKDYQKGENIVIANGHTMDGSTCHRDFTTRTPYIGMMDIVSTLSALHSNS
jgi:uridine phosphorylase